MSSSEDVAVIFREQGPYAHRILRRLGVHPADVDDAFQEVFVVVHRRLGELRQRDSLRAWVYGICIRVAARHRRIRSSAREVAVEEAAEPVDPTTPVESLNEKQARQVLHAILDQLDEDKRSVFVLFELEELEMHEVAQSLEVPVATAYSRLRAARASVDDAVRRYRARREFK
ncbi:RNA polymerase sigma factor RpoE [Labilithrix luteola]|uniref:RNA polymerase sigma factor RpoE n=1 Tax=Labilithrix luteola TaxID=1391654 RepID=A0A0K1PL07_9BACT|nr:sigma-70 family RNA polymerase sigma factor [Labilithrix luteola]AKU93799.1 RNA polymerase sigma factor RpoE [Labilithrix luteola]